jgi:ABC-type transporter Mla maintaining outer membrane lipid asymmetry ATPase subunit MlaF
MESVKLIADRVCMLESGRVVGIGTLEELELSEHPYVQQFFARRPDDEESSDSAYAKALTGLQ